MASQTIQGERSELPLVLVHIPKCAGGTIQRVMQRIYRPRPMSYFLGDADQYDIFASMPESQRYAVDLVMGHVQYGVHRHLRPGTTYITMLRDPVDRVISHYYYILQTPVYAQHELVTRNGWSLEEYVRARASKRNNNDFVRSLIATPYPQVPYGGVTEGMLDDARQHLAEQFAVCGLLERFDESFALFNRKLNWPDVWYQTTNVTKHRPKVADVPGPTLDLIREHNALDIELYRFAVDLFDRAVADQGPGFAGYVESLRSTPAGDTPS